jgi:predicted transcriptional regulator
MLATYPPDLRDFVEHELAVGDYRDENELLVHAVTVFREVKERHSTLRAQIQESLAQADRGELVPLDMAAIRKKGLEMLSRQG